LNGVQTKFSSHGRRDSNVGARAKPILEAKTSAQLRDRLIAEIRELGSSDDAAIWAHRIFAEKNSLIAEDAQVLEEAFQARLETMRVEGARPSKALNHASAAPLKPDQLVAKPKNRRNRAIDKSVLAKPEPSRVRDRDHVRSVAQHSCLICGRRPADAHHLRRGHHRELHRCGDEAAWWRNAHIDPIVAARSLWLESHPLPVGEEKPTAGARPQSHA
jgi:hypothetical protein